MQLLVQLFVYTLTRNASAYTLTQDIENPEGIRRFKQRKVHHETVSWNRKCRSYAKQKIVIYLRINGYIFLESVYLQPGFESLTFQR